MKCKYCGAKGIKISHFMKKHKALMLRKSRAGRAKASRSGPKAPRAPKRSRRAVINGSTARSDTDLECAIQTVRANGGSVTFGTG